MAAGVLYTKEEWETIKQMYLDGKTPKEIAEATHRGYMAIKAKLSKHSAELKAARINALPPKQAQKEKTLSDFAPRDIIRHLYNLGYRIENNALVYYSKQYIKLNDIVNG